MSVTTNPTTSGSGNVYQDSNGNLVGQNGVTPPISGVFPTAGQIVDTILFGDSMTARTNGSTTITAASRTSNVVTITANSHGLYTGAKATICNMSDTTYNAQNVTVTYISANQFSYSSPGTDGSASNLAASKPMTVINLQTQIDYGYGIELNSAAAGNLRYVHNGGAPGQTSADMLLRVAGEISQFPTAKLFILMTGYNDFANASLTAAQVYNNVTSIINIAKSYGLSVVVVSALPWATGGTSTNRNEALAYNRMIRNYISRTSNTYFIDAAASIIDPLNATKFSPLANYLGSDGIHPSPLGARAIATAIWAQLSLGFKTVRLFTSSNGDNYGTTSSNNNICDFAPWTNTGGTANAGVTGTVAGGFQVSKGGSCGVACSVIARSDGFGYNQRMALTPAANNDYGMLQLASNISSSRFTAGQKIKLIITLALSNVSGSNLKGINGVIYFQGGTQNPSLNFIQIGASTPAEYGTTDRTMTIVSPEITIPSDGTTGFNIQLFPLFTAAGTAMNADAGLLSIEKIVV